MKDKISQVLIAVVVFAAVVFAGVNFFQSTSTESAPQPAAVEEVEEVVETPAPILFPVTLSSAGFETTIEEEPISMISLSPSATEIIFAIDAGSQVIAVDFLSNYPETAPMSELNSFDPNVEAILAFNPDLVVLNLNSMKANEVREALDKLGIPVLMEQAPNDIEGLYDQIRILGQATGRTENAEQLINDMETKRQEILASVQDVAPVKIFHELDNTLYSVTSSTFIGSVYKDFGLENIADAAEGADQSGYPQISAEFLVAENPQIIFLADAQYGESVETVSERPGWPELDAVVNSKVIELPADISSRWGPRIIDFYQIVADSLR
ncbi:MAG: ABC transporter substrate-binding protein [Candidatus Nanopelagicales bacterium]